MKRNTHYSDEPQFFVEEAALRAGVFLSRRLGRDRHGGHTARPQTQAPQKTADLRWPAANPRALLDDVPRLRDGAWRVLTEVFLQGSAVALQGTALSFPGVAADGVQASAAELLEVALDGGARDAGQGGNGVVLEALGLEPQDFHFALDEGFGVVEALPGDGGEVVVAEADGPHG
jgi:hypothetical protein